MKYTQCFNAVTDLRKLFIALQGCQGGIDYWASYSLYNPLLIHLGSHLLTAMNGATEEDWTSLA